MKKILLFACDPGGANVIAPLVEPLHASWDVVLWGKGAALKQYAFYGLMGNDFDAVVPTGVFEHILLFLRDQNPDVIVTGTSANDFTEKYLWKAAQMLAIPSLAIVDQWMNYGIRFSPYPLTAIDQYIQTKKHSFVPTKIGIMDEQARDAMVAEGFDKERICVVGHPYLESVGARRSILALQRQQNSFSESLVIAFFSEPVAQAYSDSKHWGYTEKTVLEALVAKLSDLTYRTLKKIKLIIKIHPRETSENHAWIFDQQRPFACEVVKDCASWDLFRQADLVCGMSSMALLEAAVLGIPFLSIQLGLIKDDPFMLSRLGIVPCITTEQKLVEALTSVIIDNILPTCRFDVNIGATEKIIREIGELYVDNRKVCQSFS